MATIRHARPEDASAIADVWNPLIRESAITFTSAEKPPGEIAALIRSRAASGHAFLVAETPAGVVGFATYAQFRAGPGYARCMEHSLILAPDARGCGLGTRLLAALRAEARAAQVRGLVGGISAENAGGLAFHTRECFAEVGRIPDAGHKFGRWIDLVLVHRRP